MSDLLSWVARESSVEMTVESWLSSNTVESLAVTRVVYTSLVLVDEYLKNILQQCLIFQGCSVFGSCSAAKNLFIA